MARPSKVPDGAEVVRTYDKLNWFLTAFAEGYFWLLIVVGPSGTSKSASIKAAMKGKRYCCVSGYVRPIQGYIKFYDFRGAPYVIDEAKGLEETPEGRNLLTIVTNTDKVKYPEWSSSTKILTDLGIPMRFATTSPVCLITNRWAGTSKEIAALEDRGHLIYFDPTPVEVHKYVGTWLRRDAQDIYDFVGKNLHRIERLTCRLYVKAMERKLAGGDWREFILHHCHGTDVQVIQEILNDHAFATDKDRVVAVKEKLGISRATYYRIKKELHENDQAHPIQPYDLEKTKLTAPPPEPDRGVVEDGEPELLPFEQSADQDHQSGEAMPF